MLLCHFKFSFKKDKLNFLFISSLKVRCSQFCQSTVTKRLRNLLLSSVSLLHNLTWRNNDHYFPMNFSYTLHVLHGFRYTSTHTHAYRSFSRRSRLFPGYFSAIFSMFCKEQAKIYRKPKCGSDRAFWWLNYRETKMFKYLLDYWTRSPEAPCWLSNIKTKAQIKPNFNQNGQI